MIRVVFDTVVFVRGLINPQSVWGRLIFDYFGSYELCLSPPVLQEILEVLERPAIKRKYRLMEGRGIDQVLAQFARAPVVAIGEIPPVSRDIQDDKFLTTEVSASAKYLVSEDEDLLTLRTWNGIRVVSAATFTRVLVEHDDIASDR